MTLEVLDSNYVKLVIFIHCQPVADISILIPIGINIYYVYKYTECGLEPLPSWLFFSDIYSHVHQNQRLISRLAIISIVSANQTHNCVCCSTPVTAADAVIAMAALLVNCNGSRHHLLCHNWKYDQHSNPPWAQHGTGPLGPIHLFSCLYKLKIDHTEPKYQSRASIKWTITHSCANMPSSSRPTH